jgi:deoxyribonuclease V
MSLNLLRLLTDPPDLRDALQRLLRQIPAGRVASFGDLAEALGDIKAARWIATELQELDPAEFPVHRVIRKTGTVTGTASLPLARRAALLRKEGVVVEDHCVDLELAGWNSFLSDKPLRQLHQLQVELAPQLTQPPVKSLPKRLAGLDVSYRSDGFGVAAYSVVDVATRELLHHELLAEEVKFPYIPGYLSFRELPLYLRLLDQVRQAGRLEPWVLVDGNGILHPRRAGVASIVGWAASLRTIGVSKHLLCGKILKAGASVSPVGAEDDTIYGYQLCRGSKRSTLYVSPGHGVNLSGALRIVQSICGPHRLPDPLYHADRLSRAAARKYPEI